MRVTWDAPQWSFATVGQLGIKSVQSFTNMIHSFSFKYYFSYNY